MRGIVLLRIEDNKKVPIFLTSVGSETYRTLRNLLAPTDLKDKSFVDIATALKGHFHRQNQGSSESIATYVAELQCLASKCEFKAYLEEALCNRLVCGLFSETIQRALLAEADLTLQRPIEVAQSMVAAHKNAQLLKGTEFPVHKVGQSDNTARGSARSTSSSEPAGGKVCYRARTGHLPRDCRFRDTTCHTCGKKDHIAVACCEACKEGEALEVMPTM